MQLRNGQVNTFGSTIYFAVDCTYIKLIMSAREAAANLSTMTQFSFCVCSEWDPSHKKHFCF